MSDNVQIALISAGSVVVGAIIQPIVAAVVDRIKRDEKSKQTQRKGKRSWNYDRIQFTYQTVLIALALLAHLATIPFYGETRFGWLQLVLNLIVVLGLLLALPSRTPSPVIPPTGTKPPDSKP